MAIDLVGYATRAAGMDNVAAILAELAERMDLRKLASAASTAAVPWGPTPRLSAGVRRREGQSASAKGALLNCTVFAG